MTEKFPTWKYFFSAFAVFCYMTLDILDGKQARRTGSSSPLGQMFDHGCDAWSSQMLVYVPCTIMKVGFCGEFLVYYVSLVALFYSAQWEEYHTGIYRTSQMGVGLMDLFIFLILVCLI